MLGANGYFADLPGPREWWEASRWVLLVFTLLVALALAGSFVSYESVVAQGHPWLPRASCPGCPLCGMTRSFCAMSSGRWAEAAAWNGGGPVLYAGGWLWLLLASGFALARASRAAKTREAKSL
jgi:Protein of unknown function (DUF2752)